MLNKCVFKPDVNTVDWCKKAGKRAIKTMAQAALTQDYRQTGDSSEDQAEDQADIHVDEAGNGKELLKALYE